MIELGSSPGRFFSDLSRLLKKKIEIFQKFASLTVNLRNSLEKDDIALIDQLAVKRQALMDQVDKLDSSLNPMLSSLNISSLTRQERDLLKSLFKELELVVILAHENDAACTLVAKSRIDNICGEMSRLEQCRKGINGYAPRTAKQPRFLDIKS